MGEPEDAKARLDEVHQRHADRQIVPVSHTFQRDWPAVSAEYERLRNGDSLLRDAAKALRRLQAYEFNSEQWDEDAGYAQDVLARIGMTSDPDDLPGDYGPAFPEPEPRCDPDDHFQRECWHYQEAK